MKNQINIEIYKLNTEKLKELLELSFKAGMKYEYGRNESLKTYNKFSGYQKPNNELSFNEWYEIMKDEIKK